jgi:hypothetical protein
MLEIRSYRRGRVPGSSSTDFWGFAHVPSQIEAGVLSAADLERRLDLLRHVYLNEPEQWSKKVEVRTPLENVLTPGRPRGASAVVLEAIRAYNAEGRPARSWPIQFLVRRTAHHVMDHAWEMEDRDLGSGGDGAPGRRAELRTGRRSELQVALRDRRQPERVADRLGPGARVADPVVERLQERRRLVRAGSVGIDGLERRERRADRLVEGEGLGTKLGGRRECGQLSA